MRDEVIDRFKEKLRNANRKTQTVSDDGEQYAIPKKIGPIAYYDPNGDCYWMTNAKGDWQRTRETALKRYLRLRVYRAVTKKEGLDDVIDNHLIEIQLNHPVDYAGPLAGWKKGVYDVSGMTLLITREAKYIRPVRGEWPNLQRFLETLLTDNQHLRLYGWIKSSMQSLKAGAPFRPGAALGIAGESGCGKSLLQNILDEIFGGRRAKPHKYIMGKTDFNSEHLKAEHLMIEDEQSSMRIDIRRDVGVAIKGIVANDSVMCYRKFGEPIVLQPFWRLTITLNAESENMMVLPPIDDSLSDKILLLKASKAWLPFKGEDPNERREFRQTISRELPAFLAYLQQWKIPEGMRDIRYGVRAYQHPEILEQLNALSPEMKLMQLIDSLGIWDYPDVAWQGTAAQLEELLLEKDKLGRVARLFSFNTACGTYLSRLAKSEKNRIEIASRNNSKVTWRIHPPKDE